MPELHEVPNPHVDLAGYLLDQLEADEAVAFEAHLAQCPQCGSELAGLRAAAHLLGGAAAPYDLPPDLEARTLQAVEVAAASPRAVAEPVGSAEPRVGPAHSARPVAARVRRIQWAAAAAVAAVVLGGAAFVGARLLGGDEPGTVEVQAVLVGDNGRIEAAAEVRKVDIGRIVEFRTDDLPILPTSEFYELWFVGPGDTPERPNRISAGTFHPDEDGRSHVTLTAAVDPAKYPVLVVTAEPGDGNPAPSDVEVLRSDPAAVR